MKEGITEAIVEGKQSRKTITKRGNKEEREEGKTNMG